MSWLYLAVAVVFEIAVGIAAGKAKGFTALRWTIATLVSGAIASFFLSLSLLTFDVGVGYALSVGGSKAFTVLPWSISAFVFFLLTLYCLSVALRTIDVGIGYAVWAGIGSVGAAILGAFVLDQPLTPVQVFWLSVIIFGVVWLKLADSASLNRNDGKPSKGTSRSRCNRESL